MTKKSKPELAETVPLNARAARDEISVSATRPASVSSKTLTSPSARSVEDPTEGEAALPPYEGLEPGDLVDHFEVIEKLGAGGMGEVYLVKDRELGRRVALKMILPHGDPTGRANDRFQAEARAMARFSHPNIVSVFAVGQHLGNPYVAMEYVEGVSLRKRIADSRLRMSEALRIGLELARALAEAHKHGVIHRDLKPDNILIGDDGRARVLDFGLAAFLAPDRSFQAEDEELPPASRIAATSASGTPRYMAPEQWKGTTLSGGTDVWALGVMLYQLFTGKRPFPASTLEELMVEVVTGEPPPPMGESAEVPSALDELVARCLERNQDLRPTAAMVATSLSNIQDHVVASSPRPVAPPSSDSGIEPTVDMEAPPALPSKEPRLRGWDVGALVGAGALLAVLIYVKPWSSAPVTKAPALSVTESAEAPPPPEAGWKADEIRAVTVGRHGGCFILHRDATVMCWGQMTGNSERPASREPVPVAALSDIIALGHGMRHRCALRADGTVWCWGSNDRGQLGDGSRLTRATPVQVTDLPPAKRISVAGHHSCALTKAKPRQMMCWGSNRSGELGQGDRDDRDKPSVVPDLVKPTRVGAGDGYSCAVNEAGELRCWGNNDRGQLGLDPNRYPTVLEPTRIPFTLELERVYPGVKHTCGRVASTRRLACWGANDRGQLGDGTTESRHTPKLVPGIDEAGVTFPGARHTCVLTTSNAILCFGANDHGQLGQPRPTAHADKPIQISSDAKLVNSKTAEHTCFVEPGGLLRCTGLNDSGQLGDGTNESRYEPAALVRSK